jgi:hypothetical protein
MLGLTLRLASSRSRFILAADLLQDDFESFAVCTLKPLAGLRFGELDVFSCLPNSWQLLVTLALLSASEVGRAGFPF